MIAGPGEYTVPSTLNTRGGRFSTAHTGKFILDVKGEEPAQEDFDWGDWENFDNGDDAERAKHFGSVKDLLKARKAGKKARDREHRQWEKAREESSQFDSPVNKIGSSGGNDTSDNAVTFDNNSSQAEGPSPRIISDL